MRNMRIESVSLFLKHTESSRSSQPTLMINGRIICEIALSCSNIALNGTCIILSLSEREREGGGGGGLMMWQLVLCDKQKKHSSAFLESLFFLRLAVRAEI
jgi:hypothetical protein